jgi:hypothetical protein
MSLQRPFVFAGSLWELVRFFSLLALLAALFRQEGGRGGLIIPWILLIASNALLSPVGWFMLALYPGRYGNLLPLLRLGKLLSLFSLVLLLVFAYVSSVLVVPTESGGAGIAQLIALPIVLFFDLIFLALLISLKPKDP